MGEISPKWKAGNTLATTRNLGGGRKGGRGARRLGHLLGADPPHPESRAQPRGPARILRGHENAGEAREGLAGAPSLMPSCQSAAAK